MHSFVTEFGEILTEKPHPGVTRARGRRGDYPGLIIGEGFLSEDDFQHLAAHPQARYR